MGRVEDERRARCRDGHPLDGPDSRVNEHVLPPFSLVSLDLVHATDSLWADRALSSHSRNAGAGAAPVCRAMVSPRCSTISVGMPCTPKRSASRGDASTLTFTSFTRPA